MIHYTAVIKSLKKRIEQIKKLRKNKIKLSEMSSEELRYLVPFGIAFCSWIFYKLQIEATIRDVKSEQDKRLGELTSKVNDQSTTLTKVTQVLQQRNPQNVAQRPPNPQAAGNASQPNRPTQVQGQPTQGSSYKFCF